MRELLEDAKSETDNLRKKVRNKVDNKPAIVICCFPLCTIPTSCNVVEEQLGIRFLILLNHLLLLVVAVAAAVCFFVCLFVCFSFLVSLSCLDFSLGSVYL